MSNGDNPMFYYLILSSLSCTINAVSTTHALVLCTGDVDQARVAERRPSPAP